MEFRTSLDDAVQHVYNDLAVYNYASRLRSVLYEVCHTFFHELPERAVPSSRVVILARSYVGLRVRQRSEVLVRASSNPSPINGGLDNTSGPATLRRVVQDTAQKNRSLVASSSSIVAVFYYAKATFEGDEHTHILSDAFQSLAPNCRVHKLPGCFTGHVT